LDEKTQGHEGEEEERTVWPGGPAPSTLRDEERVRRPFSPSRATPANRRQPFAGGSGRPRTVRERFGELCGPEPWLSAKTFEREEGLGEEEGCALRPGGAPGRRTRRARVPADAFLRSTSCSTSRSSFLPHPPIRRHSRRSSCPLISKTLLAFAIPHDVRQLGPARAHHAPRLRPLSRPRPAPRPFLTSRPTTVAGQLVVAAQRSSIVPADAAAAAFSPAGQGAFIPLSLSRGHAHASKVARALYRPACIQPRRLRAGPSRSSAPVSRIRRSRQTAPLALHSCAAGVSGYSGSSPARHVRRTSASDLDRAIPDDDGQAGGAVRAGRRGRDGWVGILVGARARRAGVLPGSPGLNLIRIFLLFSSHPSTPAAERAALARSRTRRSGPPRAPRRRVRDGSWRRGRARIHSGRRCINRVVRRAERSERVPAFWSRRHAS
jgi:hypothetical protein